MDGKRRWIGICAVLAALCLTRGFGAGVPAALAGSIYKYVDENGVVHFTNVPTAPGYQKVDLPPLPTLPIPRKLSEDSFQQHIHKAASIFGVDPRLVRAIIKAESDFDPMAVSHKGAMGLMQLMPQTAKEMGVQNPFDPLENIFGGVRYLKEMLRRFNNSLLLALAAYNAGPEAVEKYGGIPPFQETNEYLRRVLRHYMRLKRQ
ncbi:MAG: lytic transglycosylase protein [Desulfacinum sp.]|jgi:soluble lytic murein transglycosylase|nr:lytic transglycosylase protein [Desulfacinum sp.]